MMTKARRSFCNSKKQLYEHGRLGIRVFSNLTPRDASYVVVWWGNIRQNEPFCLMYETKAQQRRGFRDPQNSQTLDKTMKEPKWIAPILPPWVEPYAVVWVDVAKLEASWRQTRDYVGVEGTGAAIRGRYEKFGQWFALGHPVEIPSIGFYGGEISFTDGRHRFAWFRDHGVTIMPVHVEPESAGLIKASFGADIGPDWQPAELGEGEI